MLTLKTRTKAGHEAFVLRGDGVIQMMPNRCDYFGLREYNVVGMVGLYKEVVPYK